MRLYLFLIFFLVAAVADTQSLWISSETSDVNTVDLLELPVQDNSVLFASARSSSGRGSPKVFAFPVQVSVGIKNHGTWESTRSGRMVWRQRIRSEGAYSMNVAFTNFNLPETGVMFLYDVNKTHVIGPISAKDNDVHREWWSPILPFDEMVVEVQVEEYQQDLLDFHIRQVNHDFSGLGSLLSGSCNLDVVCGEEDGYGFLEDYRDVIQSVGLFLLEGFQLCSGFLINNTRNDCSPYFLTAYHCDVTPANAASVVVYWNYQNSFCRIPGSVESGGVGDGTFDMFNSGAEVVAGDEFLDFRLLRLDDEVDPETQPFFAGWDVEGETFDSTICVHHPNGDEKRISFDFDPPTVLAQEKFVRVEDWDIGTTEEGSSGSPLFSQDKLVIGLLSEGLASCQNDLLDDFASLKLAWEGGGTPETRLKDWLDPDNTGTKKLAGKNCARAIVADKSSHLLCASIQRKDSVTVSIQSGFESGAELMVMAEVEGLTVTIDRDSIFPGSSALAIFELDEMFNSPSASFGLVARNGNDQSAIEILLRFEYEVPSVPDLLVPENNASILETDLFLQWESTGATYEIQLFTDTAESPLLVHSGLRETSLSVSNLVPGQNYFWRAKANNVCGASGFGAFSSFEIVDIVCNRHTSDHDPIAIPEVVGSIESTIMVPVISGVISDVNVIDVRGRHTYLRDLQIQVVSPSGKVVDLVVNPCFDEDNFFASFDDESEALVLDCPFDEGKTYKPKSPLSSFDGEQAGGIWKLVIDDQVNMDGGTFLSWGLEICVDQRDARSISFTSAQLFYCSKSIEPLLVEGILSDNFNGNVQLSVLDESGNTIASSFEPTTLMSLDTFVLIIDDSDALQDLNSLRITAESDGTSDIFTIPLIREGGPSEAQLLLPKNNEIEVDRQTTFTWDVLDDVDDVRLVLYKDDQRNEIVLDTILRPTEYTLDFRLEKQTKYWWEVITLGQCADTGSQLFSFTTEMSVSVNDVEKRPFTFYPNPASNRVFIDVNPGEEVFVEFWSITGQLIMKADIYKSREAIDVSILEDGVYLLLVRTRDSMHTQKIVLQR